MVFERYVQVGRVVLVNFGSDAGKLATIVDVVDANKCLIDGPETGVARQIISFKRINLTDITVKIPRSARASTLKKAWAKNTVVATWEKSAWSKKMENKKKRVALSDFGRFKVMVAKKQKRTIVDKMVKTMKK